MIDYGSLPMYFFSLLQNMNCCLLQNLIYGLFVSSLLCYRKKLIFSQSFISLQIKEFCIMALSINDSIYSCLFFFLTRLHFFHLTIGLFLLSLFFWSCSFPSQAACKDLPTAACVLYDSFLFLNSLEIKTKSFMSLINWLVDLTLWSVHQS